MSEKPPADVLGALPRSRPHRRSEKRRAKPVDVEAAAAAVESAAGETPPASPAPKAGRPPASPARKPPSSSPQPPRTRRSTQPKPRLEQPAQPAGAPSSKQPHPSPASRHDLLGTAVQAAAELAEIGLSAGARALRRAVSRLPRP